MGFILALVVLGALVESRATPSGTSRFAEGNDLAKMLGRQTCLLGRSPRKRLSLGTSYTYLPLTALFTVACACQPAPLAFGTAVALMRVLCKSTTGGKDNENQEQRESRVVDGGFARVVAAGRCDGFAQPDGI